MQRKFLKENTDIIHNAIQEAFAGSKDSELTGSIEHYDYSETDCSDMVDLEQGQPGSGYGPGLRVAVQFNDNQTRRFFYPENECHNIEEFIDNLNTDFGMAQIMYGKNTSSLGIVFYDLNNNTINFTIGYNEEVVKPQFNSCWDVNTLTFNVNKFNEIKSAAEKEAGIQKTLSRGTMFSAPVLPDSIKVIGINKKEMLNQKSPEGPRS
jgi:hypothetical protein